MTTTMTTTNHLPPVSEATFQRQVIELAKTLGWLVYHPLLSKWSEPGWPDLAMVRPPRLILAELKGEKGKLTLAQMAWLGKLSQCEGIEVYSWWPRDLEAIAVILRPRTGPGHGHLEGPAR